MSRIYKTVRLSVVAKQMIDTLIDIKTEELNNAIREEGLQERMEEYLLKHHEEELNGISVNVLVKVTIGSVIEEAVRYARQFSIEDLISLASEMESETDKILIKEGKKQADATPRLYISKDIYAEIEYLQLEMKRAENTRKIPRLSYVIKILVYALYRSKIMS